MCESVGDGNIDTHTPVLLAVNVMSKVRYLKGVQLGLCKPKPGPIKFENRVGLVQICIGLI